MDKTPLPGIQALAPMAPCKPLAFCPLEMEACCAWYQTQTWQHNKNYVFSHWKIPEMSLVFNYNGFFFLPSLETEMTANVNIHKMLKIDGWLIRINNAPSSLSSFGAPHGQPCSSSQPQFSCSSCTSRIWWRGRAPRSRR